MAIKHLLGLIGYPLGHSFSKGYFTQKFEESKTVDWAYQNFPLSDISELPILLKNQRTLLGLNVTIPYKKDVIPYLDELDELAQKVGAVNTICINEKTLIGYNTDVYGFVTSLKNNMQKHPDFSPKGALILGTGGASEAVKVGLTSLNIPFQLISRKAKEGVWTYEDLHKKGLADFPIVINTTPLGMYPKVEEFPNIPYQDLTEKHLLFDLVYNPEETAFLRKGKIHKSICINGLEMLALQADAALEIWETAAKKAKRKLSKIDETTANNNLGKKPKVDFENTQIAFANQSDSDLKDANRIFKMMSKPALVKYGSKLGILALKLRLPFVKKIVKNTVYKQFCGGTTLLDSLHSVEELAKYNTLTILDYSAEGKDTEAQLNKTMNEIIRAIEFAKDYDNIPIVSVKVSGLAPNKLLTTLFASGNQLEMEDLKEYRIFLKRMDNVCYAAQKRGVTVYFDAEESWMQDAIDHVVTLMMRRYNKQKAIVFNTYQLYRHDRLAAIMKAQEEAVKDGYILGVKTVRGAYMDQERTRAKEMGYQDPIQPNKKATDEAYNLAVRFCLDNIETVSLCNATHNANSCQHHIDYLRKHNIPIDHPNQIIAQLYGMSDNITFNLGAAGYRVAKYLPYGPVQEVLPYLIRRAEENTSITGDLTRERAFILKEIKRRGLS